MILLSDKYLVEFINNQIDQIYFDINNKTGKNYKDVLLKLEK